MAGRAGGPRPMDFWHRGRRRGTRPTGGTTSAARQPRRAPGGRVKAGRRGARLPAAAVIVRAPAGAPPTARPVRTHRVWDGGSGVWNRPRAARSSVYQCASGERPRRPAVQSAKRAASAAVRPSPARRRRRVWFPPTGHAGAAATYPRRRCGGPPRPAPRAYVARPQRGTRGRVAGATAAGARGRGDGAPPPRRVSAGGGATRVRRPRPARWCPPACGGRWVRDAPPPPPSDAPTPLLPRPIGARRRARSRGCGCRPRCSPPARRSPGAAEGGGSGTTRGVAYAPPRRASRSRARWVSGGNPAGLGRRHPAQPVAVPARPPAAVGHRC